MKKILSIGLPIFLGVIILLTGWRYMGQFRQKATSLTANQMKGMMGYDIAVSEESFGMTDGGYAEDRMAIMPVEPGSSASADTTVGEERLIIKTGDISIVVEDVPTAADQIKQFAESQGGFVVSSNIYKQSSAPMADVTIRIPVARFDAGLGMLAGYGEVVSQNINGQDVTEEFVDLDAQIRNLRSTEEQFLQILKQATRIEDILAVQRELTSVRSQIDRIEGRMNYLSKSAQLSTLYIHLSTNPEQLPVYEDPSWKPLAVAKDALRSLRGVGIALMNLSIWLLIYAPVWIILILLGRWGYKKMAK